MIKTRIRLSAFEKKAKSRANRPSAAAFCAARRRAVMEFHINREVRNEFKLEHSLFSLTGNVVLADIKQVRELAARFNAKLSPKKKERFIQAGQLYAMGLIDEILHYIAALYREQAQGDVFESALSRLETKFGAGKAGDLLETFSEEFPPQPVYAGKSSVADYLKSAAGGESCKALSLEEIMLLALANMNPAFKPFKFLFDDAELSEETIYPGAIEELKAHFKDLPPFGPSGQNLWDLLRAPALASPDSLTGQLEYMRKHWGLLAGRFLARLLAAQDFMREEDKPFFGGPGPTEVITYKGLDEYERFSPDQDWMPRTVLMAKSTLVWLFQLSQKYGRDIVRLDQIPDEELDELARRGFTGLWLIGLWERSNASKTIKQWTGNFDAAASAYSLYDYDIAGELGGWGSLLNLRERCFYRGIRLGSDMVPNHTGLDSRWIEEHPDRFLQMRSPPFPAYTFNGGNLSAREGIGVYIEDHYYNRSDAAVVFKRVDFHSGDVRYIYHGNDGTSMPWNDTAQIDFLNPEAREAVIRTIVGVCKQFPIVRFDAAMTLAKRHIQRLWYPEPGKGGDIASRSEHALSNEEFNRRIPNEFWREVVDRCAVEAPNTLLLAEAFWMMEGYFVRTLGMHRVYNSAFMNMLKNEENAKYRTTIKNTLEFDPEILKRFVNFMNNPDEETSVAQFGKGDKYFGIATLLVTMPGLPMFGHGQIEGFEEKYGMEYRRSYRSESPDQYLVDRHEREIFPLMKRRAVFSGSAAFRLYDLYAADSSVNENVLAYSNRDWDDRALVLYNNSFSRASGWIFRSSPAIPHEGGSYKQDTLSEALSIHGQDPWFTLLREQRSGLWFIRSSKELSERGLFVSLNGYQSQVFMDIHEVEDTKGKWARLHHDLNGRGTADPEAAIQDIFLGELYYRFTELFKPALVDGIHSFFTGSSPVSAEDFAGSFRESARIFAETADRFMDGANGQYDPWTPPEEEAGAACETGPDKKDAKKKAPAGAPSAGFKNWRKKYKFRSPEEIEQLYADHLARFSGIAAGAARDDASAYLKKTAGLFRENPGLIACVLGYIALSLLRSIIGEEAGGREILSLLSHWRLDRKLGERLGSYGENGTNVPRLIEQIKACLARTSSAERVFYSRLFAEQKNPAAAALAIITENYKAEDFRALLGINRYQDVIWFNKEGFEESLFYAGLFCLTESGGHWLKQAELIAGLEAVLKQAEEASEYKLEGLIEALSRNIASGGTVKKSAVKTTKRKPKNEQAE
jgi:glycosidase